MKIRLKFCFLFLSCTFFASCTSVVTKLETSTKITQKRSRTAYEIQTVISSHQDEIKRLHKQMVNEEQTVQFGFIIFRFEINPDGSVGKVELIRNNFGNLFAEKMTAIIKSWKFNRVDTEDIQLIELPYAFTDRE